MPLRDHVDPFIGVDGAGNCLPGPYLPFSLVRLGPDTLNLPDYPFSSPTTGYRTHQPIVQFSHTHVSGTGGGGRYGNIGVTPLIGYPRFTADPYQRENERASAGYYAVRLLPAGIDVELTCTPRVGVHRYRFPQDVQAHLLIDVGSVIQTTLPGEGAYSIGGYVELISETEVVGRGDYRGGWGHDFPYSVYFYARVDQPFQKGTVANAQGPAAGQSCDGIGCKALLSFDQTSQVHLSVGISYVSIAKARASLNREVGGASFDTVRGWAEQVWEQALSPIQVEGGTPEQRTLFYTLFTRLLCMPTDLGVDDEYAFWHSNTRHFTDLYALWDSVRNANALLTLLKPQLEVDLLNFCLDVAEHVGWLPDAWIAGHSALVQGGSSVDVLFCEAALKGLEGVDYARALSWMCKNSEVEPSDPRRHGRYLTDYHALGYVSTNVRKACVSRHLEYAYQDWCIGRLAKYLDRHELAEKYMQQSRRVWNLWRDDLRCFAPRKPSGAWVEPFDPARNMQPEVWLDPYFYEGTAWQWSFNVQHDFAGLLQRHGGDDAFVDHLDTFFECGYYFSKETMMHIPYLYHYAGRPDKTAERVAALLASQFRATRDGLQDNEDMGCQSAWYMWSAMGLYPIMGQDIYLVSSPLFDRVTLQLGESERFLVIEREGTSDAPYVESATLNGQPLERAWLRHAEIIDGATLQLKMSHRPSGWGRVHRPPSPLSNRSS